MFYLWFVRWCVENIRCGFKSVASDKLNATKFTLGFLVI